MEKITRVGVDLAKRVYQVHAVDNAEHTVLARPMSLQRFVDWAAGLSAGTVVAMESCSGAHHLARRLRLMGLDARLIAAHFIAPFRVQGASGKTDANDAAAICEAASRAHTRYVPVKTPEQQGWQGIHRLREGYKEERTACINRIRGLLAEFGLVAGQCRLLVGKCAAFRVATPGLRNRFAHAGLFAGIRLSLDLVKLGQHAYLLRVVVPDIAAYDKVYKRLIADTQLSDVSSSFAIEESKYTRALPLSYV